MTHPIRKVFDMDERRANDWKNRSTGNLIITEESQLFFRHADLFLTRYEEVRYQLLETLQLQLNGLKFSTEEKKRDGKYARRLTANSLNTSIRNNFKFNIPEMKFEVDFKEGVFYDTSKIGGFDFALFDETYNLVNFRNYCFGRRAVHNGSNLWRKELYDRAEWRKLANASNLESYPEGRDIEYPKNKPTIIGEFQFGNWALVYYDILKTIYIEQFFDIDFLVYITASGNLSKYISDGTVNFESTKKALVEFESLIKFPIWLIGVDFE